MILKELELMTIEKKTKIKSNQLSYSYFCDIVFRR